MQFDAGSVASYTQKRHPYYIFAADFRDTSGGVIALHYLCHALNRIGESAYILNTQITKPGLNVRFLSAADCWHHKAGKLVPIMVYPEIVSDNPYNAMAVVRYMLNVDGRLTGRKVQKGIYDLTFYHSRDFVPETCSSPELMQVPVLDDTLFTPLQPPLARTAKYLVLNRVRRVDVDFSQLPSDVQILDASNPKSLAELAVLFQRAAVLYSYEASGTCICAMLAGCPVIYVRNSYMPEIPGQHDYSTDGSAFIDEPGGVERAMATVGKIRQHWQRIKDEFPLQLAHFVDKSQAFASSLSRGNAYSAAQIMQRIFGNVAEPTCKV